MLHAHYLMIAELPRVCAVDSRFDLWHGQDQEEQRSPRHIRMHRFFIGFKYLSSSLSPETFGKLRKKEAENAEKIQTKLAWPPFVLHGVGGSLRSRGESETDLMHNAMGNGNVLNA